MLMNVCCVNGCTMKVTRKVAFFGIEQNANELITTPCTSVFCCQTFHTADKHFFVPLTFKCLQIFSDGLHCHLAGNDSIKTSLVEKFVCFFRTKHALAIHHNLCVLVNNVEFFCWST